MVADGAAVKVQTVSKTSQMSAKLEDLEPLVDTIEPPWKTLGNPPAGSHVPLSRNIWPAVCSGNAGFILSEPR
jgi:hypothetical protein